MASRNGSLRDWRIEHKARRIMLKEAALDKVFNP